MRIQKLLGALTIGLLLFATSCKTFTPEKLAYLINQKSYHYWADIKKHERGVKFYIVFKGERLNNIQPISLKVGKHTMPLEADLYEPSNRDDKSVLTCTTIYKEKKAKTATDFPEVKNTLYGKEPFTNAVFKYKVRGKEMEMIINDFTLHHKNY
jgi:hypothetical protein